MEIDRLRFSSELNRLMLETASAADRQLSEVRPFVCDGNPQDSEVFVVGTNAASTVPWSPFWDPAQCLFQKNAWFAAYKQARQEKPLAPGKTRRMEVSRSRSRIDIFTNGLASKRKVLETNIYSISTPSEKDLQPKDRQSSIFEFLVEQIKPQLLFVHGETARAFLDARYGIYGVGGQALIRLPHADIPAILAPHLAARKGGVTNEMIATWAGQH